MKIVVTCGHPHSGFQLAYQALARAGLAPPLCSRRESLSPAALHGKIFVANDLDAAGLDAAAPLSPGNVWQDLAADLFIANIEQRDWGWAEARSVWLLDFWKGLDPQVRFVLVYAAPESALGDALGGGRAGAGEAGAVLASWLAWHTEMLRFYNRNPDCCLLVNAAAALHDPGAFVGKVAAAFGVGLAWPDSEAPVAGGVCALAATLAKALIEEGHEAHALYRELESAADLAGPDGPAANAGERQALEEYTVLLDRLDLATAEAHENAQYADQLKEGLAEELQAQIQQLARTQDEYEELKQQHAKSVEENGVLLLQLHQVQEELEHNFLQWQELSAKWEAAEGVTTFINRFWRKYQPNEVVIDFRDEIECDNWYNAGVDGRWAGPGSTSTVKVPALCDGRYEFNLEVIGAMTFDIIAGMEVFMNGSVLQTIAVGEGYPVMVYSEFTVDNVAEHPVWEFQFKFPKLVSPSQHGSSDNRNLAIRVRSLKLRVTS